ncbi:hypothetical protein [Clostridium sp. YIM B02555]|uniref:hypothetical protein n=1 Tax=Clostridium sp. YIM B02555 TaxID=2911968 RepID=UPI001EEED1B9|nr:hypothetical protein [Clostridium sp. YIM B02555]
MNEEVIAEYHIKEMKKENLEKYKKAGVWALWAENVDGKRVCLEVAQTSNIYKEINSALYILSNEDDLKCKQCSETYDSRQRHHGYSVKFKIHKCKSCEYVSNLRIKSWKRNPRYIDKYQDMILNYQKFEFVSVDVSPEMEKKYAQAKQALYWFG